MPTLQPSFALLALDSLHSFVRDLSRSREHYVERLGFRQAGLSGAELEAEQATRVSMLESGDVRLLLMAPLGERSEVADWLARRPEGVGRIVLEVDDAALARELLQQRGARPSKLVERKTGLGRTRWFEVATPFGALLLRFVQYEESRKVMPGLICRAPRRVAFGSFGVGRVVRIGLGLPDAELGAHWLGWLLGLTATRVAGAHVLRDERARLELTISTSDAGGVEMLTLGVESVAESVALVQDTGIVLTASAQGYELPSLATLSADPGAAALQVTLCASDEPCAQERAA